MDELANFTDDFELIEPLNEREEEPDFIRLE